MAVKLDIGTHKGYRPSELSGTTDGHSSPNAVRPCPNTSVRHHARKNAPLRWMAGAAAAVVVSVGFPSTASAGPDPESGGGYRPGVYALPYNYQKQAAGHWCSAAAARIALSVRGKMVSQKTLAAELKLAPASTTGPGLQSINTLADTLNKHLGRRYYKVYQWSDTNLPTKLREHVRYNIDHKLAVVINVNNIGDVHFPPGHYAVIVGYRFHGSEYLIADPSDPSRQRIWMSAKKVVAGIKLNRYVA